MPELPEVETVRRGLERETLHQQITGVEVANGKVLKGQAEADFRARVLSRSIESITRRGKYLLITLGATEISEATPSKSDSTLSQADPGPATNGNVPPPSIILCLHLKMRGQIRVVSADVSIEPYHCVSLLLGNGSALRFHDMWTWGEIRAMTPDELRAVSGLAGMGPEPLGDGWSAALLTARLGTKRTAIKAALLNQSVIAGVGNIYADEALFRAGINPLQRASGLSAIEVERLAGAIHATLLEAVAAGGTSSEEFLDVSGSIGGFRPQVYDRGGGECVVCGTTLTRIRLAGRGTVFCPGCQPAP